MVQERLFKALSRQKKADLLGLLESAYEEMDAQQRRNVFGALLKKRPPQFINGKQLLADIQQFHRDSLNGVYYAPFNMNSKNFLHIPEETSQWFDKLDFLLKSSAKLSKQNEAVIAIECFKLLYDLVEHLDEIVFAEEIGMWLLPGDEKVYITAYLTSLATTTTPEQFTEAALPLVWRDSIESFCNKVYATAKKIASAEQIAHLKAEMRHQKIRTSSR